MQQRRTYVSVHKRNDMMGGWRGRVWCRRRAGPLDAPPLCVSNSRIRLVCVNLQRNLQRVALLYRPATQVAALLDGTGMRRVWDGCGMVGWNGMERAQFTAKTWLATMFSSVAIAMSRSPQTTAPDSPKNWSVGVTRSGRGSIIRLAKNCWEACTNTHAHTYAECVRTYNNSWKRVVY